VDTVIWRSESRDDTRSARLLADLDAGQEDGSDGLR
jgi:hypothetical protein